MKALSSFLCAWALVATSTGTAADESFRCGKWIVSSDLTPGDLLSKCGEPTDRESWTEDVLVRNRNNGLMVKVGVTETEIWTFDRGSQAAPMVVTIVDGKIRKLERAR